MSLTTAAFLLMIPGALALSLGVLARLGVWRRWSESYFDEQLPDFMRNGAFAMLPNGCMFLAAGCATLLGLGERGAPPVVLGALLVVVVAGLVLSTRWTSAPPEWMKPSWLRVEEAQRSNLRRHAEERQR